MRIECIESLDELGPVWKSLESRNPASAVFQSWEWNACWVRTVMPGISGAALRCYAVVSDSGRELAIIPCFRRALPARTLAIMQLLGSRMSFVNDIVCAAPEDEELARDILSCLDECLKPREIMHLKHMNGASAFTRALVRAEVAEIQCKRLIVPLHEEDPMRRLSTKRRKTLSWQRNKLRREFGGCDVRVSSSADAASAFDRFALLHQARFEARGDATLLRGTSLHFVRTMFLSLCRAGKAEILELLAGERVIASLLGILGNDRYYWVNGGFDTAFERFSPMKLLATEAMRRASGDLQLGCFELGPDYESYKQLWRPDCEFNYTACLKGPGTLSRLAAAGYRAGFRRVAGMAYPRA